MPSVRQCQPLQAHLLWTPGPQTRCPDEYWPAIRILITDSQTRLIMPSAQTTHREQCAESQLHKAGRSAAHVSHSCRCKRTILVR